MVENNLNLDQHFLTDEKIIKAIIKFSKLSKGDCILEIGPGKGILTKELINYCKVLAIELDRSFENELKNLGPSVEVFYGNALNKIHEFKFNKIYHIIS